MKSIVTIPQRFKALVLKDVGHLDGLAIEEFPIPQLKADEVLIKTAYSPIHPADILYIEGRYGFQRPYPNIPGTEASGTVVATGTSMRSRLLKGKKVSFAPDESGQGTWSEYAVVKNGQCVPILNGVDLDKSSLMLANPLTAIAMVKKAKDEGFTTILQNAANGHMGSFINFLAEKESLSVINIVRSESAVSSLKEKGAQWVLNSSCEKFQHQLKEMVATQAPVLFLDAVTGPLSAEIFQTLPSGSKLLAYGKLVDEATPIDLNQCIFFDKKIEGFWVTKWLENYNILQLLPTLLKIQAMANSSFAPNIHKVFHFQQAFSAISDYNGNMSNGKILLKF